MELGIEKIKSHWDVADNFKGGEYEFIKSFIHHNYSIGFHTHSFYELNIVLKGNGIHFIERMTCEAKQGCVFLIPPGVKHGYVNHHNLDVYHMLIHRNFLEVCFKEFEKNIGFSLLFDIEPYLRSQYAENIYLVLEQSELDLVKEDIEIIKSCESLTDGDIYINATAKKILAFLCMRITRQYGGERFKLQISEELRSITDCLNYIHQNYSETLTLDKLANFSNMSRSTFIRHFTKICRCSPHQYVLDYRLQKAKEFLKERDKSFTEIAQLCGFYDASHLRKFLNIEKQ